MLHDRALDNAHPLQSDERLVGRSCISQKSMTALYAKQDLSTISPESEQEQLTELLAGLTAATTNTTDDINADDLHHAPGLASLRLPRVAEVREVLLQPGEDCRARLQGGSLATDQGGLDRHQRAVQLSGVHVGA